MTADPASRRTLLALLAAGPSAAFAAPAAAQPAESGGAIGLATTRAALARHPGDACFLTEGARAGLFLHVAGAAPAADPLGGLYLPSATPRRHWARHWNGVAGLAEWFGAVPNDPRVDCRPAIEAALALCIRVHLRPGDYHCHDTLVSRLPGRKLIGAGIHRGDPAWVTRVVVRGATADVFRMGLDAPPRAASGAVEINGLALEMLVEGIEFDRTEAPATDRAPRGVVVQWCQDPVVRRCKSQDSLTGFAWAGTINLLMEDCRATRARAGTGAAPDRQWGFHAQTPDPPLTEINGNASARLVRCNGSCTPAVPDSTGLRLDARFTDHSIEAFETAAYAIGIHVVGDGAAENRGTNQSIRRNANLEIVRPWIDQFASVGLRIDDLDKFGIVRVSGGYFGPLARATACVYAAGCRGTILLGGEIEMAMASTAGRECRGVLATGTRRLLIGEGVTVLEASFRAFDFANVDGLRHAGTTVNEQVALQHHTLVTGTATACVLRPALSGAPGTVKRGIDLPAATTRTTVDLAAIDWAALPSRSARLLHAGRPQPAGAFGTDNLATG